MDQYTVAIQAVVGLCALVGVIGGGVFGWKKIRQALTEEPQRQADVARRLGDIEETQKGLVDWRREHMKEDRAQHGEILDGLGAVRERLAVFEAALPAIERIPGLCETVGRIDGRMDGLLKMERERGDQGHA